MISIEGKNWDLKEKFSEDHWDTLWERKKFLSLNLFFSTLIFFFFKNSDKKQKKRISVFFIFGEVAVEDSVPIEDSVTVPL